jgi:integrase
MARAFGLRKVGRYWHADFWVGAKHIHRSTRMTSFPDAEDVARQWHTEEQRKAQGLPVDQGLTVRELWARWWAGTESYLSESHRNRVAQDWDLYVLPAWGDRPAKGIRTADAEELRRDFLASPSLRNAHYAEKITARCKREERDVPPPAPRSIASGNKLLLHAHLVWTWAVKRAEILARVPWSVHIDDAQEKPKDTLSESQIRDFLAQIDRTARNPHVHVAVRAMLYLALREKEALVMRWEWFSPDLATFQHGERKAKDAPRYPVPLDLRERLQALCPAPPGKAWERPASGLVLPRMVDGEEARHWGQFTTKAIARAAKTLKLKLTPHSLRHSWATMTARKTGNAHLVKDGLGHKALNTATKYVKLSTRDLAEAQAKVFGDLAEKPSQPAHKLIHHTLARMRKKTG